jgi:hypothetical protein
MTVCIPNASAASIYDEGFWYWVAGPIIYFAVALFGFVQIVLHVLCEKVIIRHYIIMLTTFVVSLCLRGTWFMLTCPYPINESDGLFSGEYNEYNDNYMAYTDGVKIMSKISLLLYFTAFTMYVYLWAKVMPFISVRCLTIFFVVINIVLWLLTAILESIAIVDSSAEGFNETALQCGIPLYNSIICILAIMQLIIAFLFCTYGFRLMFVLRKAAVSSRRDTRSRKKVERRVLGVSIPSSILFLFRSILFLWCPVANSMVPHSKILYPWFFYLVPDIIPVTLIFLMTIPASRQKQSKSLQYEKM